MLIDCPADPQRRNGSVCISWFPCYIACPKYSRSHPEETSAKENSSKSGNGSSRGIKEEKIFFQKKYHFPSQCCGSFAWPEESGCCWWGTKDMSSPSNSRQEIWSMYRGSWSFWAEIENVTEEEDLDSLDKEHKYFMEVSDFWLKNRKKNFSGIMILTVNNTNM